LNYQHSFSNLLVYKQEEYALQRQGAYLPKIGLVSIYVEELKEIRSTLHIYFLPYLHALIDKLIYIIRVLVCSHAFSFVILKKRHYHPKKISQLFIKLPTQLKTSWGGESFGIHWPTVYPARNSEKQIV